MFGLPQILPVDASNTGEARVRSIGGESSRGFGSIEGRAGCDAVVEGEDLFKTGTRRGGPGIRGCKRRVAVRLGRGYVQRVFGGDGMLVRGGLGRHCG